MASAVQTASARATMVTLVRAAAYTAGPPQPAMDAALAAGQAHVSALQSLGSLAPAAIVASQVSSEPHATSTALIRRLATGVASAA